MIITKENAAVINTPEVYMHDDVVVSFECDRICKKIQMRVAMCGNQDETYIVCFENIAGFFMTSCDFWGASERICGMDYIDPSENLILPSLQEKWNAEGYPPNAFCQNDYIEIRVTFISGDVLQIACQRIDFGKETQSDGSEDRGRFSVLKKKNKK